MIFQTDETRNLILDTAWKIFLKRGFFDTQMKDIAQATGLSRTSLYRYFQDKPDLAMALVERTLDKFLGDDSWLSQTDEKGHPIEGIDAVGRYLKGHWLSARFHEYHVFLAEFDAYFSGSRVPPGFREDMARAVGADCDTILVALLEKAKNDGSLRPGLDLHLTMATVINAVRGLQQRLLLRGNALMEVRPDELDKMTGELVDYLVAGLRAP
jgi:AcrR family transcriptional regulator